MKYWWAVLIIPVAVMAVYWNSLSVPFLFDDDLAIVRNPTIARLWPPWDALSPPRGSGITVSGRPILNLSFAINRAISGNAVWSYHALNLLIHGTGALLLFAIVRRSLLLPVFNGRFVPDATFLALAVALIWALHPLQTVAVTYIAQRAESLAALWYLLILYALIRGCQSEGFRRGGWLLISVLGCFVGMASKETLVTAPVVMLLYDRCFLSGSFRTAFRLHWRYFLSLAAAWGLLAFLIWQTADRGGTAGAGLLTQSWPYLLTQCHAVVSYAGLLFWPHPLVFDHGEGVIRNPVAVLPQALLLLAVLGAALVALWRRPPAGFAILWFFLILAPTSSVVPVPVQTMAEHRAYLAVAGPVALAVVVCFLWLGRTVYPLVAVVALALGVVSVKRNSDYRDEVSIWSDTVAKKPQNGRAFNNLGSALMRRGEMERAEAAMREALRLEPLSDKANQNLALILARAGRRAEAYGYFQEALRLNPEYSDAWCNLGGVLLLEGEVNEAVRCFRRSIRANPENIEAWQNLAPALQYLGDKEGATLALAEVARLKAVNPSRSASAQPGSLR